MIDIKKLLADCEFHIKRGDGMVMQPDLIKALAAELQQAPAVAVNEQLLGVCKELMLHASMTEHMSASSCERAKAAIAAAEAAKGGV